MVMHIVVYTGCPTGPEVWRARVEGIQRSYGRPLRY